MKKIKLLLLTSTLLLPGMLSFNNNNTAESRVDTSAFITRPGTKKAISYNQKFSYVLFDGSTMLTAPSWSSVKNKDQGGSVVKDERSGIEFTILASSTNGFKYVQDTTDFDFANTIKTGGETSESNRFIKVVIPEGITAKIKSEIYVSNNDRVVFVDKLARKVYYEEVQVVPGETGAGDVTIPQTSVSPYGQLSLIKGLNDFESAELSAGTYYLNFNGTMHFGRIVVEMTGLTEDHFMDGENTIEDRVVKIGNKTTSLEVDDKIGLKFSHWSLTPNGTAFDFANTPVTEETTFYAVFKECETFTVTFNSNYAGSTNSQVTVNVDSPVAKPTDPKRTGYKFAYWMYNNRAFDFKTLITEDITLFARWELDNVPTINGPDSLKFGYSKLTDIEAILLQYSAKDIEDGSLDLKVEKDSYSLKPNEIGNYEITLSATDSSGNKVAKTIPVEVYDDLAPSFDGPTTIYKSTSIALTTNDILNEIKATDAIDGDVKIETTSDSYTGYANKVGDYALELLAKDKNDNAKSFTLNINVTDKIANVWYVPEKTINVQSNIHLTDQDVIDLLIHSKELLTDYSSIKVTSNYSFDTKEKKKPGIYSVKIAARYYNGQEITLDRSINVYDSDEATQKRDNWFNKACKWTYNTLIKNPCNFFIRVYNEFVKLIGKEEWQGKYLKGITIYE